MPFAATPPPPQRRCRHKIAVAAKRHFVTSAIAPAFSISYFLRERHCATRKMPLRRYARRRERPHITMLDTRATVLLMFIVPATIGRHATPF